MKPDASWLPARPADGHKGTFGRVLVIAGSRGMSGAACLSGKAALRGGAGLVYVACPVSIQAIVAGYEPGYLTIGLPEDSEGRLAESTRSSLKPALTDKDAIALGPGLGQTSAIRAVARWLYREMTAPLVLDADGLNVLAEDFRRGQFSEPVSAINSGPRVLTPHPGEFSRLSGRSIREIEARREVLAREFALQHQVTLVLKGPGTIVTDGERLMVNTTGNSGMATGGTGDVLTGLIAALLTQNMGPFEAARLAVHLHGLAGDIAAEELSEPGLIASDLPLYIGRAWKQMQTALKSGS